VNDDVSPTATLDVALIGAGRVGTAVAALLRRRGHRIVAVTSRSDSSARRAAELLDAPVLDPDSWPRCDLVMIGTVEDAIESTAEWIAPSAAGAVVVHFAGATGTAPLTPAAAVGARVAAIHPVQSIPSIDAGIRRILGCAWGVTCDDSIFEWTSSFISAELDGRPVRVEEDARSIWHAAAVTTSNGIAALLASGEAMLEAAGISDPDQVLGALALGTVLNALEQGGGAAALTGPVVRGESATIARHLAALEARAPELAQRYRLAAQLMFVAASSSGRLDLDARLTMSALLEES
jgi:predicted short-subunit dehydrogenase-like oxidoreductase (DUF2520 family)